MKIVKETRKRSKLPDLDTILFLGSFDGETDVLSQNPALRVYNSGVGFMDTVYNLQRYILKSKDPIRSIVFLGSAGAYPHSNLTMGDIVFSHKFIYKEIGEIKNYVKVPDVVNKHILTEMDPKIEEVLKNSKRFKETIVNSTNYVTLVDLTPEELVDSLYDVGAENMEAFAVAYVANRMGLNFTAFLYITNMVGAFGSEDWQKNWRNGSHILQNEVLKILF